MPNIAVAIRNSHEDQHADVTVRRGSAEGARVHGGCAAAATVLHNTSSDLRLVLKPAAKLRYSDICITFFFQEEAICAGPHAGEMYSDCKIARSLSTHNEIVLFRSAACRVAMP